jgi:capsular exopolysaccharide synthesis family protein
MSRIFDALQRSETERAGVDMSTISDANELLQHAERGAASQWEATSSAGGPAGNGSFETAASGEMEAGTPFAANLVAPADTSRSTAGGDADVFSLFQSLKVSLTPDSRMVSLTDREGLAAEAFRLLGVRLRHLRRDRPLQKVLITSTLPQEGKSMVSANLACTLAQATQRRTLLLEGDVRRPTLSKRFGIGANPGICEWLQGERNLMTCIYHLEGPGHWILPSGQAPSNALELLQSAKLASLMDQLAKWFDWIVIDSPPVLPLADTSVWARLADGILLVTRIGTTEKQQLQRGLEALESKKILGALMNCSTTVTRGAYYYQYAGGAKAASQSVK